MNERAGAWTPEAVADLAERVAQLRAATGMSRVQFAKETRLTEGRIVGEVCEQIRAALSVGNPEITSERAAVLDAIERYLEDERSARAHELPAVYVRTRPLKLAFDAIAALLAYPTIGVLTGYPGSGKSLIVAAAAAEFPTVAATTVDVDSRTIRGLLRKIASALGLKALSPRFDDVIRLLKQRPGTKPLRVVIIDQSHNLKKSALQLIADLHDAAGCSFLLVGTVGLHRMTTDDADPLYGQFSSRVGLRLDLAAEAMRGGPGGGGAIYTLDDIKAICRQMKIKLADDGARMLLRLANEPGGGHLRRVVRLTHWAARFASRRGASAISSEDILAALELVTGEQHQRGAATGELPSRGANTKDKVAG
ncbi:MAG: ATP-binding protein [Phycisphaerae bacterium]|nr:ATP-binding protein [Phycisphaerae bacterium]